MACRPSFWQRPTDSEVHVADRSRLAGQQSRSWRVLLTVSALALAPLATAETDRTLPEEYERLMTSGCDPERFDVATAIEARVLRNLPFAMAGQRLASPELVALYSANGDWYRPEQARVELSETDRNCVGRLHRHERRLREQLPIDAAIEAVLTRDAGVFWSLREHARYPNAYRNAWSHQDGEQSWSWGFVDGAACGGDGSPEAAEDCAGFTVVCHRDGESAALVCELIQSG